MHSSISNSDDMEKWPETYWKRPIPTAHWRGVSLLTALLVLVFLIGWETYWRLEGYTGSSRIQFDLDLDAWEQDFGGPRPICLALVGTNPRPFLTDIANDPDFRGLLLVGVTEMLFFSPDGSPPFMNAVEFIQHRANRSLSARSDFLLSMPIESGLASVNKEDLALSPLIRYRWVSLPNREGAYLGPRLPPYFGKITEDRRNHMWYRAEHDTQLQEMIQQIWLKLFRASPPFGGPGLDALIASVKADVDKITERGGRVVFLRFPSTGGLWDIEQEDYPREGYWNRLLEETGAPGIHFADGHDDNGTNIFVKY